ncbi:EVI5-like protein isoform X4 [Caloenas nicobarica]|uniref:EVI5-like protein isoform X4 n=1 Tax=Caloenas nicobarica TaxID=187106 RepID=UPI0032B80B0E
MASPAASPDSSVPSGPTSDSENLSPDELELLAKLEEQNRLLEADSKSMRSVNGSRRNSGSSLVSSSSASSNLGHLEEDTWILWGRVVNEWDEWRKKKEKLLKELIRKGIPHHFRAIVWQLLCSATDMPVKNQYSELLKMSSPCEKLIRRDIARTYPEHEFFKGQDSLGQEVLFNVMKAYSLVDREVGYCQGSAFIVGLLLMQMPEEEAFCVFVRLMQEYRLRELFKPSMAELGLCIYQFEYLLQEQLPELNVHFRSQSFLTSMYASSWFLTLFLTTFPLPVATRVFDIFMYEGLEIVFRVGLALLQFNQAELVQLDMEGMSQFFQKVIPHQFDSCPDKLILKASQVKFNAKKMKRLEKEYAAIKNKEMEEQIEIKRLRTENRLLKQRIETLEKESAALADRLIQGQVTRAQEAEQNDVIRRELAVAKQQCSSATQNLQRAQSTIRQLQGQQGDRGSAELVSRLQSELQRSRLRENESRGQLRQLQHRLGLLEKQSALPGEAPLLRLQEELQALGLREAEAAQSLAQLQQQLRDLSDTWQDVTELRDVTALQGDPALQDVTELQDVTALRDVTALQRAVVAARLREAQAQGQLRGLRVRLLQLETQGHLLQEQLRVTVTQAQGLQAQLSESHRKHAEAQCKREEGLLQGQLDHSDAAQYIRQLKGHIEELKAEIRLLRGPLPFGAVALGTRLGDEDSLGSSDDELPPFAHGDIGDLGDMGDIGDSSDSETEGTPAAP